MSAGAKARSHLGLDAALKRHSSTVVLRSSPVVLEIKVKVKGSGQECPLHTVHLSTTSASDRKSGERLEEHLPIGFRDTGY
jgi:hypothetical protein